MPNTEMAQVPGALPPMPPVPATPPPAAAPYDRSSMSMSQQAVHRSASALSANQMYKHRSTSGLSVRTDNASTAVISTTTAVKCEVMVQYLRQRQLEKLWSDGNPSEGVILKRAKHDFVCQPPELSGQLYGFYDEIRKLNVKVCIHTWSERLKH